MPIFKEELTEEQKTQRQISAMGDSLNLINELITKGQHTQEVHDTIDRNYRHLELMLGKDNIKKSGSDLKAFEDAVTASKTFIAVPIT